MRVRKEKLIDTAISELWVHVMDVGSSRLISQPEPLTSLWRLVTRVVMENRWEDGRIDRVFMGKWVCRVSDDERSSVGVI